MRKKKFKKKDIANWSDLPKEAQSLLEKETDMHMFVEDELYLYRGGHIVGIADVEEISGVGHIEVCRVFDKTRIKELYRKN